MAQDYQHAISVNQKLGFARILIKQAETLAQDDSIPARQQCHAYLDGAASQLSDAVVSLIFEVLDGRHLHEYIDRGSLSAVILQLQGLNEDNGLLRELQTLLQTQSWLRQLNDHKNNPQFISTLFANQDRANGSEPINNNALLATDKSQPKGPIETVSEWLINIQQLVERHRNQAIEE